MRSKISSRDIGHDAPKPRSEAWVAGHRDAYDDRAFTPRDYDPREYGEGYAAGQRVVAGL